MKTNKTFQNTALTSVDDDYRFVLGKTTGTIKNLTYAILKGLLAALNWTFSGNVTFSNPVTVATATAGGHAVTKTQLDTKQNTITGTDNKVLYKTSSGVATTSKLGISSTINAINIPKLASAPASTSDAMGSVGDIGWSGADLYLKTDSGWVRERFETF